MFKDIDFSFKPHPLTGDLVTLTDSRAIVQSLKNIVRSNFTERGFNVELGTNTDYMLFENMSPVVSMQLRQNIENSIRNFEPRVDLINVLVTDSDNQITIELFYNELNNPVEQTLVISLERVR